MFGFGTLYKSNMDDKKINKIINIGESLSKECFIAYLETMGDKRIFFDTNIDVYYEPSYYIRNNIYYFIFKSNTKNLADVYCEISFNPKTEHITSRIYQRMYV